MVLRHLEKIYSLLLSTTFVSAADSDTSFRRLFALHHPASNRFLRLTAEGHVDGGGGARAANALPPQVLCSA